NSLQSNADQASRISKSVFVSNFPDGCTARDLWNVCNDYGTAVDVFIPAKKSKAGKRRFLCTSSRPVQSKIYSSGLEEIPLGGCKFTWCHKSGAKMSKLDRFLVSEGLWNTYPDLTYVTLDCFLSDHKLILMRESHHDYGPTSFRFYHYWFELDGFDNFVKQSWKNAPICDLNAMVKFSKKILTNYTPWSWLKTKIKWAIEGVLIDGEWVESPSLIKSEFLSYFTNHFDRPLDCRLHVTTEFPRKLSPDQQSDLEIDITQSEIKKAVWDCEVDKAPGPDGFTFGFYRRYWTFLENDVVEAVHAFFNHGKFPKGTNSSFITLIPKNQEAKTTKDFRLITLIGSVYKIITKILANRMVVVLEDLVNEVQSAFVSKRQILDGPFILNELYQWCIKKRSRR
nr:RNA-directed DNA polymerase, eukaryota, reverse transcriptase zinc-binding domain protein [Tanacetum cinerariifolium]